MQGPVGQDATGCVPRPVCGPGLQLRRGRLSGDGLQEPSLQQRGMAAWVALQFNHIDPQSKEITMSQYNHNTPEQMLAEHEKPHDWPCGVCHNQDPNSDTSRSATEVHEKRKYGEDDKQWYDRVRQEKIRAPKYKFVLEMKLARGCCEYPGCGREVTAENATGFDWDHVVQSEKRRCMCKKRVRGVKCCADHLFGTQGGVSGLAICLNKASALDQPGIEDDLRNECGKCRLYCRACHTSRKPSGRARWDASL